MTRDAEQTPSPQSVVVPVEPTEDMMLAGALVGPDTNNGQFGYDDARTVFVAMLAAAPAPSSPAGGEVERAARALLDACIADFGDPADYPDDDGWVASGDNGDSAVTFKHLRDLQAALSPEAPARDTLPEDDELPGDFLARVGMDGALWATEFRKMALKLGHSDMDEGWLIGWFCNAVMAGYDHAQRRYDPALTPRHEAPASEGEAVVFRDVFLSWHEECGTVERAGYGASPIGKFQNRWPGFHKKLWDAAMTSHDALRDAWVKVAKECEK